MKSGTTLNALLQRLILLCVLPLLLLAIYLAWSRVKDLQQTSHQAATRIANNFALVLDQNLAARISGLQVLAASAPANDPPQLAALYQQALAFRNNFGGEVIFADRSMQMLLHTRMPLGAALPKLPQPTGYAAAPSALSNGTPAIGDKVLGPIVKEPLAAIAVPVMRDGNAHALLLNLIETARLQRWLDNFVLPSAWVVTILDSRNNLLARRGPPRTNHAFAWRCRRHRVAHAKPSASCSRLIGFRRSLSLAALRTPAISGAAGTWQ